MLIQNSEITIRHLVSDDINERYLQWMSDKEINRYLESRFTQFDLQELQRHFDIYLEQGALFLAIEDSVSNLHIGNLKIGPVNPNHKTADIGILIGDPDFRGRGIAAQAIKMVTDYAFENLGVSRLFCGIYEANTASIRAFQKAGYKIEGVLVRHVVLDGVRSNTLILGQNAHPDYR